MASNSKGSSPHHIMIYTINCKTEAEKEELSRRLDHVRLPSMPPGRRPVDNETLLNAMFDIVEGHKEAPPSHTILDEELLTAEQPPEDGVYLVLLLTIGWMRVARAL